MKIVHASVYPFPIPMRAVLVLLDPNSGGPSTEDMTVMGGQMTVVQDEDEEFDDVEDHKVRHHVLVWDDCNSQPVTTMQYEAEYTDVAIIAGPSALPASYWEGRISRAIAGLKSNRAERLAREEQRESREAKRNKK